MSRYRFGLDVSRHQGKLDWQKISEHSPPVEFCAIRCGVSWAYEDGEFKRNWVGARSVGIPCGAYHVLYPGESIFNQVGHIRAVLKDAGQIDGDLPIIADIELHHGYSKRFLADAIHSYLVEIERVFARKPVIYSARWFMDTYVDGSFMQKYGNNYKWWIANYRKNDDGSYFDPILPTGLARSNVLVHQYSDSGVAIGGTGGNSMDYNRFLGTDAEYGEFVGMDKPFGTVEEEDLSKAVRMLESTCATMSSTVRYINGIIK